MLAGTSVCPQCVPHCGLARRVSPPDSGKAGQRFYTLGMPGSEIRELIFEVREADEGGYVARALGESIFAEAESWPALESEIRDAVECHYDVADRPAVVRLHFVRDQVLAL